MNENEITLSIKEKLSQIEQRENIRILYACGLRMDYAEAYCSTYRDLRLYFLLMKKYR